MEQQRFSIAHWKFREPDSCGRTSRSQQVNALQTRRPKSAYLRRSRPRSTVILAWFPVYRGYAGLGTAIASLTTFARLLPWFSTWYDYMASLGGVRTRWLVLAYPFSPRLRCSERRRAVSSEIRSSCPGSR